MKLYQSEPIETDTFLNNLFWQPRLRVKCFFLGHDIVTCYERGAMDYCARCYTGCPEEQFELTIPYMIARAGNRIYTWTVERDWKWFEQLDYWLQTHVRLPSWWEY